nr:ribonuclease H-like domain-containing protein [Tanacetum cinerariifolium]
MNKLMEDLLPFEVILKEGKLLGKNSVLFTDTACVVLSPDFKLTDESHVLLKVPRKDNMYSVDLKNFVPYGGLSCLFAKATSDESNLWHMRLGHVNFKTINKLVKGNLVRGLPSKVFKINQTCVPCRVLVIKPQHKTTYELLLSRKPALSFMRPFGCPVTILNTIDHLGKFDGKADDRFFIGYSTNRKSFRVFNSRTRIVEENLHVKFSENTPNIVESGPNWLFDIDTLTIYIKYKPVVAGNQCNGCAGAKACNNVGKTRVETVSDKDYILLPLWTQDPLFSSSLKDSLGAGFKPSAEGEKKDAKDLRNKDSEVPSIEEPRVNHEKDTNVNNTNNINTVSTTDNAAGIEDNVVDKNIVYECANDPNIPDLIEAIRLFLAYASFKDFVVYQMDVKSTFLYGKIKEEVYVCQPPSFEDPDFPNRVYKVEKALYGLHQAPRAWEGCLEWNKKAAKDEIVNPTIYTSCIEQFWDSFKKKTTNREEQLQALVDRKKVIITEATIKRDLQLEDAEGVDCLPNAEIFKQLTLMGYENLSQKLTFYKASFHQKFLTHTILQCLSAKIMAWNEFSSTMASAIICLATNQKFNFSKYILEIMVKHLDSGNTFLMYLRFVQVFLNNQLERMDNHTRTYVIPSHIKKVFGNMRRVGKDFSDPTNPHHTPTITQPSPSKPQKKHKPRNPRIQNTEETQPSGPTTNVEDDAFNEKMFLNIPMIHCTVDLQGEKVIVEEVNAARITTSVTAIIPTISMDEITLAKALIEIKTSRHKGKGILVEPEMPLKKKAQISLNEEFAFKLQAEEDEQELIVREKAQQIEEVNLAWDDIQAKVDANYELAPRTTEKRNKPPTKAQQRSLMCTYLKNIDGWKPRALKNNSFAEIKELFDKALERINNFVDFRTELVEESTKKDKTETAQESISKRARDEIDQERSKKQK